MMNGFSRYTHIVLRVAAAGVALVSTASLLRPAPAQAQVAYGSYVGIGGAVGLTNAASTGEGSNFAGVISGRYRFLELPISLRAQAFLFGGEFAFVPTVSYDVPISWNMDAYLAAGASFTGGGDDDPSPVGDKTAFVLQPGIDYIFPNSNLAAFGNAVFAFDAYEDGGNMAISIQGGVGIQF